MLNDFIKEYRYPNGELQRIHVFVCDSFKDLNFGNTLEDSSTFNAICNIYDNYLIKAAPYIFGRNLLFHLPNSSYFQRLEVNRLFRKYLHIKRNGDVCIKDEKAKDIYDDLSKKGLIHISSGLLPLTKIISIGDFGFLSKEADEKMKVNSLFFIFDPFDCASEYDEIGTAFGLLIKDRIIINPPLFNREALMISGNQSFIKNIGINDIKISINNSFPNQIYSRPSFAKTPIHQGYDVIVVKNMVVDIRKGGRNVVPASGFILSYLDVNTINIGDSVQYRGFEDIDFAIQVANSALINGEVSDSFKSPFYNIRKPFAVPYPPSLYPLDYQKARAARVVIGADKECHPHIILFEGASKLHYQPGLDSCGASLKEVANICKDLGLVNAVNLDGGGSAALYIDNKRYLKIADRIVSDGSEAERPVPSFIYYHK